MSTHASKRVLASRELGKALYRTMKADWEWAEPSGESPYADEIKPIIEWWRTVRTEEKDSIDRCLDLCEAADHAGLSWNDTVSLIDYIKQGPLFGDGDTPVLDLNHLWELTRESLNENGDDMPMPDDWKELAGKDER
ncbi:hypothetical protein [Bifidobacterium tissieri]|uniref:Uncharacterized protein n=1 Tax=Bifidobacterium tissieri TaxID=1630162 RepID=A0A5M9ZVW1_9BIFI|nr:hypothetical protein [Bifidobacterium tissieri]KAA8828685.1 hypothetical protein EM849_11650 [Bifidobacterium tissieri]KAA8831628.1 hypothetical protein EMO89_02565 [Bifidobacterium tissieri]